MDSIQLAAGKPAVFDAGMEQETTALLESLVHDLYAKGFSIRPNALPLQLAEQLLRHVQTMPECKFDPAGIGRDDNYMRNKFVRTDEICWITGQSEATQKWLAWADRIKTAVNRRLFLGLFSFESHFAHYAKGDYYKRHMDAFRGEANRTLSLVVYLNPDWNKDDGGELVIYQNEKDLEGVRVTPSFGTVVAFLSEEFPHEVLPALRDRYSIAGWFRINTSNSDRVDPPT